MRVLFWGTPEYAVPALYALLGEGHEVAGVVTQPDRPAGRGRELRAPPIKTVALEEGLPVFQPESASDSHFVSTIRALNPEISIVIAYGQILRREVLDLPTLGSINAHASLLPELRGAAPINWAIVRGFQTTGVTIMRMVEKMDAGPIIYQVEEPIADDESASDLWARLSEVSAEALVEALTLIEEGQAAEVPQDESKATFAPRIERDHARIDWKADAATVYNLIRGMDAVPGAWSAHDGEEVKLFRPRMIDGEGTAAASGTIIEASSDAERGLVVACGSGAVAIREVQPPGKRRMTAAEWTRGRGARGGERFI